MRRVLLVLGLTIAFVIPASTTAAADWSMAGGDAARTGSTTAEPSALPGFLWGTPVSGPVTSAPIVSRDPGATWGATVFAVSGGAMTLNALDAADGAPRWSDPLSSYSRPPWVFRAEGGLVADSAHVYVLVTEQNGALNEWRETLFARSRSNGTEAWNVTGTVYGSAGTPSIRSAPLLARDLIVFGSGDDRVRALRPSTGAIVWEANVGEPVPLPVTFLETGNALVGDFILALDVTGRIHGLDVAGSANGDQGLPDPPGTGDLVWTSTLGGNVQTAALATPTAAYVAVGPRVLALHPAFGSTMWTQTLPAGVVGPLSLAENSIVSGHDDDRVRALNATTGAAEWVRSLGGLESWVVSTPRRIFTGAGTSMVALDPLTGDVTWSADVGAPARTASVSENATGAGVIYAGMSSPDRVVAFSGSFDLQALDISLTPISSPDVFQATVDASIANVGDMSAWVENVSSGFRVWLNDSIGGISTVLRELNVPYLAAGDDVRIHIESWSFASGTHTISLEVERVPGDRNSANNVLSSKFFASAGPPRTITMWSPAFGIGLIVVGVAGVGLGWLVAVAQRRREQEAAEVVRARQGPRT